MLHEPLKSATCDWVSKFDILRLEHKVVQLIGNTDCRQVLKQ